MWELRAILGEGGGGGGSDEGAPPMTLGSPRWLTAWLLLAPQMLGDR